MKLITFLMMSLVMVYGDIQYTKSYNTCMDNSGGVTMNMLECTNQEIKHHDTLLNAHYKQAMKSLEQGKKEELKNVQRMWIKYRDAKCGFYVGLSGGTMDRIIASGCYLDMTAQRAAELKDIYETM